MAENVVLDRPADPVSFQANYRSTWANLQAAALAGTAGEQKSLMPTYRLPVVIHVVHDCAPIGDAGRNPTEASLRSVLDLANQRFRHQHPGAASYTNPLYGPDTEIEICLATVDPNGDYTTGIVRHNDPNLARSNDWPTQLAALNTAYGWPSSEYLNLFLVEEANTSGGYFGMGRMLIVTDVYNSGLICHEVGHYLGLAHTFSGSSCINNDCTTDGDGICDTPPKPVSGFAGSSNCVPNNSCTTDTDDTSANNPYRPTNLGGMGDQPDMLPNYMDYTGSCWDAFSVGQKARMISTINANWSSNAAAAAVKCAPTTVANQLIFDGTSSRANACTGQLELEFTVRNGGNNTVTSFTVEYSLNGTPVSQVFTGNLAPGGSDDFTLTQPLPAPGSYSISPSITDVNGVPDAYPNDSETCLSIGVAGSTFPVGTAFDDCSFPGNVTVASSNGDNFFPGTLTGALGGCIGCHALYYGYNQPAQTAEMCFTGVDVSTLQEPALRFTYGHIPRYDFISNTLSVEFRDCAGGAQTLWTRSGLALGTNNPPAYVDPGGGGAAPDCSELEQVTVSIPVGTQTGDLCFVLDGLYFSPLLIDTFEIFGLRSLPVELTTFTAVAAGKHNKILWETSAAPNVDRFVLEVAGAAATTFTELRTVRATGASGEQRYEVMETDVPIDAVRHYRLRAIDSDGSQTTYGPVTVRRTTGSDWVVFPNPARTDETLRLRGPAARVQLLTPAGRLVGTFATPSGTTALELPALPPGVYFLRLEATPDNHSARPRVQRIVIR